MSNRRTAKLRGGKKTSTTSDTRTNLLTPVQTHGKMFSTVSPHLAQLKHGLESLHAVLWGPLTGQSELAGVKQTCHFLELQAVIKIKLKKQKCIK